MSSPAKSVPDTTPRRRDAVATRAAILEAAKAHFAKAGYDGASLRDISGAAGCDVALIKRYFGGKDGLFTEALKACFPDKGGAWDKASFAYDVATAMADNSYMDIDRAQSFQFLLRTATSPTTAPMLNLAMQERFLAPFRDWLGGQDAEIRARILASLYIGLLVERLIRNRPLKGADREVFIAQTTSVLNLIVQHSDASGKLKDGLPLGSQMGNRKA